MLSFDQFTTPDGKTDWDAYRAAQVAAGAVCYKCRAYIFTVKDPGHQRLCTQCQQINGGDKEITHDRLVVCPDCRHAWSPYDSGDYDMLGEDERDVTCPSCAHEFVVVTRVTYTFTSKPKGDDD